MRMAPRAHQVIGERFAVEVLEYQEVGVAVAADVEQRADVRMLERRDRACLALEPLAQLRS